MSKKTKKATQARQNGEKGSIVITRRPSKKPIPQK